MFTVESYLSCCKEVGLSVEELQHITLGMALDYQTDYINLRDPDKQTEVKTRRATQADIDNF
ncbi:hypothetical protein F6P92_05005 [Streptococcus suis]|nr:hypothetical protein [Streptococcus suis]